MIYWNKDYRGNFVKSGVNKRRNIKSGYSNNPDYFGDWFGEGQIDFSKIINPEDDGNVWMVKMWSGSGYVLDVYLCKATNVYDAIDTVFEWSWENEGENNMVFDLDYVYKEADEYFESDPYMFSVMNRDEPNREDFVDRFIEEYYVSDSNYELFARSENFFVDEVPAEYLTNSRKPVKSSKFYVEYYDGADSGYVSYDNDSTIDFDNAMTFNSKDEADEWVDEHKDEWKSELKVQEITNSRKSIKSGKMPYIDDKDIDKFEERLNKGEEVKMKGWTFRKDDTGRISVIDPDGNLLDKDFKSVASFIDWFRYWKKDSLKSSRKPIKQSHVADINYYKQLVKSVLSNRMTEDEALTKIASRNNCNKKYAESIYNNWMDKYKEQLIKSDAEVADIQKEFNVDGDIYSWAEDYMPGSGKANTKGGELVRAAHRILSEYYNNGNMIGRGFGNETTNPAARYIVEKTNFDGNGEIEDMLNHIVRMDDGQYNSWCKRFESDFANYLRSNAELFDEPNDDDIADYVDENDKEFFIKKFYVEDDFGNKYVFIDKEENFVCDEVDFAEPPAYNEGDIIKDGDEFSSEIDKNEEYGTFEKDGFTYDWEADSAEDENGNYDEWKIVRVTISDQLFEKEDVLDFEDIEKYKAFDMNGNELTEEELLSV